MNKLKIAALCCCALLFAHTAESFLGYGEIRFFEEPEERKEEPGEKQEEDLWTEPIIGPDGRLSYYRPPDAVLRFVENPTEENAQAYLEWNRKRFESLQEAQEVLSRVVEEQGTPRGKAHDAPSLAFPQQQAPSGAANTAKAKALYFIDPECAYCEQSIPVINDFARKHARAIDIQGITLASDIEELNRRFAFPVVRDSGEIRRFGISVYPTMIFSMPDGRTFGIRGFADRDMLEKIWGENINR